MEMNVGKKNTETNFIYQNTNADMFYRAVWPILGYNRMAQVKITRIYIYACMHPMLIT